MCCNFWDLTSKCPPVPPQPQALQMLPNDFQILPKLVPISSTLPPQWFLLYDSSSNDFSFMIPCHWFLFHDLSNWFTKKLCLGSHAGVIYIYIYIYRYPTAFGKPATVPYPGCVCSHVLSVCVLVRVLMCSVCVCVWVCRRVLSSSARCGGFVIIFWMFQFVVQWFYQSLDLFWCHFVNLGIHFGVILVSVEVF